MRYIFFRYSTWFANGERCPGQAQALIRKLPGRAAYKVKWDHSYPLWDPRNAPAVAPGDSPRSALRAFVLGQLIAAEAAEIELYIEAKL